METYTWLIPCGDSENCFQDLSTDVVFKVLNVTDGIVHIDPDILSDIYTISKMAMNCFEDLSNFHRTVFKVAGALSSTPLNGIKFYFNDVEIVITKETKDFTEIWKTYCKGLEKQL